MVTLNGIVLLYHALYGCTIDIQGYFPRIKEAEFKMATSMVLWHWLKIARAWNPLPIISSVNGFIAL